VSAIATAAAVAAFTLLQSPHDGRTATAGSVQPLIYYALGDSVAAGHGLEKQLLGCRRCRDSYPWLVRDEINHELASYVVPRLPYRGRTWFFHLACSGAASADVVAQVKEVLRDPDVGADYATLVSITVGPNDFDFLTEALTGRNGCAPESEFESWVDERRSELSSNLNAAIDQLKQRDNVYVIVTDVMNPFNRESAYFDWVRDPHFTDPLVGVLLRFLFGEVNPACAALSGAELYARTETVVEAVAEAASEAADGNARVAYVPVAEAFASHESATPRCGSDAGGPTLSETWIQHGTDGPDVLLKSIAGAIALVRGNDCFHPNAAGQQAYAGLVFDAVEELLP
jgi:lysophospholipase L1-like esterase